MNRVRGVYPKWRTTYALAEHSTQIFPFKTNQHRVPLKNKKTQKQVAHLPLWCFLLVTFFPRLTWVPEDSGRVPGFWRVHLSHGHFFILFNCILRSSSMSILTHLSSWTSATWFCIYHSGNEQFGPIWRIHSGSELFNYHSFETPDPVVPVFWGMFSGTAPHNLSKRSLFT